MKSLGQIITEEVDQLTIEKLRERLATAERLIYVLEIKLKDKDATITVCNGGHADCLAGSELYNLVEDEKKARAAYEAARRDSSIEEEKKARDGLLDFNIKKQEPNPNCWMPTLDLERSSNLYKRE